MDKIKPLTKPLLYGVYSEISDFGSFYRTSILFHAQTSRSVNNLLY